MRLRTVLTILMLLMTGVTCFPKDAGNLLFLKTRVARDKVTAGENIVYEIVLYSTDPSIAGVEPMSYPVFDGVDVRRSAPDNKLTKVQIDGKTYFTAVVDRYFLRFPNKGKYPLKGANYRVGINRKVEYVDPFWGPALSNNVEVINLSAPDVTIKVSPLPEKGRPSEFSGAVGDFELSATLPEGKLRSGEDMIVMVSITGTGYLEGVALPDIRGAMPEGLQFKSMTDTLSHYVKDGELGSELEIECILSAKKEGTYVIDNLKFNYYNTLSGRYETITAPSLELEVESGTPGSKRPAVLMEI